MCYTYEVRIYIYKKPVDRVFKDLDRLCREEVDLVIHFVAYSSHWLFLLQLRFSHLKIFVEIETPIAIINNIVVQINFSIYNLILPFLK